MTRNRSGVGLVMLFSCAVFLVESATAAEKAPRKQPVLPATKAASAGAAAGAPTQAQIQGLVDQVKASHSNIEASPLLSALSGVGARAIPPLSRLIDDPAVHPEVRFYLVTTLLGIPDDATLPIAARFVKEDDPDLRRRAMLRLMSKSNPTVAPSLAEAILKETDTAMRANLLEALGQTGDTKMAAFLAGYIKPGQPDLVLAGATAGLAHLGDKKYAATALALLRPDVTPSIVGDILDAVDEMMERPGVDTVVPMARNPAEPLRLYAVYKLQSTMPPQFLDNRQPNTRWQSQLKEMREAAASALDDPNPLTRGHALIATGMTLEAGFRFIADNASIERILGLLEDPDPYVRYAVITTLHDTLLRRGLMTPGQQPAPLDGETMRMLRWPSDWITFPRYVALLDDPDQAMREKVIWMLGVATGYWYGYSDIRLLGTPQITAEVKAQYQTMWNEMKAKTPARFVAWKLGTVIEALARNEQPETQAARALGVKILTGRSFGWSQQNTPDERAAALAAMKAWWEANQTKHPVQWIVDAIRESKGQGVDNNNLYFLSRWRQEPLPVDMYSAQARAKDPDSFVRRIVEWWETVKPQLEAAAPSAAH